MRYYSTQRPIVPGSYPSSYAAEIVVNFDQKTFCEEVGREAWGYIDFAQPLPEGEAQKWELTQAGMKTYWCVTTSFDDRGRVVSVINHSTTILSSVFRKDFQKNGVKFTPFSPSPKTV